MKVVPLVVYLDGERKIIGEAAVSNDGLIEGKITTTEMTLEGVLETGMVFGSSPGPLVGSRNWTEQSESLF